MLPKESIRSDSTDKPKKERTLPRRDDAVFKALGCAIVVPEGVFSDQTVLM